MVHRSEAMSMGREIAKKLKEVIPKQKAGKARMKRFGKVDIPAEVLIQCLIQ